MTLLEKQFGGAIPEWITADFSTIEEEINQEKQILKLQLYNQLYYSLLQPEEVKTRTLTKNATSVHEITTTRKPVNLPQEIIVHLLNTTLGRGDITSDADIVLENSPLLHRIESSTVTVEKEEPIEVVD